jgi:hypothetical protein
MKKSFFVLIPVLLLVSVFMFSLPCDRYLTCDGKMLDILQYPGLWFLVLIPLSLLALILNNKKHNNWLIITGIFFIISMIIVYLMPEYDSNVVFIDRELTNWFFVGLYSLVSVIYFIIQFVKYKIK